MFIELRFRQFFELDIKADNKTTTTTTTNKCPLHNPHDANETKTESESLRTSLSHSLVKFLVQIHSFRCICLCYVDKSARITGNVEHKKEDITKTKNLN